MTPIHYEACIEACIKCMNTCNYSYISGLKEYNLADLRERIQLERECADMCGFAVQAMTRRSLFVAEIARLCAEICEACADEYEKSGRDECRACIEACRACADACRRVSEAATAVPV